MRPGSIKHIAGTVVIVGDDQLARATLAAAIGRSATVAGLLAPMGGTAEALARFSADVVVWDLGPGVPDFAPLQAAAVSGHTIVALIAEEAHAGAALAAGAAGVHLRDGAAQHLPVALAAATEGMIVLDEALRPRLLGARSNTGEGLPLDPLTPREREVLALLAEGRSNRDIGLALGIAERTAKFHVNAILQKLDADGRTEAVVRAARLGLIVL